MIKLLQYKASFTSVLYVSVLRNLLQYIITFTDNIWRILVLWESCFTWIVFENIELKENKNKQWFRHRILQLKRPSLVKNTVQLFQHIVSIVLSVFLFFSKTFQFFWICEHLVQRLFSNYKIEKMGSVVVNMT